jgi:hypothetical protein
VTTQDKQRHSTRNQSNFIDFIVKIEFTAPDASQHNCKVACKFATLFGKVRATQNEAMFTWHLRQAMWAYYALLITKIYNALICSDVYLSPYELFYD